MHTLANSKYIYACIIRWTCLQIVECKVASRHVQEHMCMQILHVLQIIWPALTRIRNIHVYYVISVLTCF